MKAIEAISQGCTGTLKDGTLKYEFRIDPKYRAAASELFGEPGSCVAVARLTQEASIQSAQDETIEYHIADDVKKPKGGELAKWAGILCNDPKFQEFIECWYCSTMPAKEWIYIKCGIDSRSELDHKHPEGLRFRQIMAEFEQWKAANEAKKV